MADPSVSYVQKDLEQCLVTFSPVATTSEAVQVKDLQPVASYSWIDAPTPTIAVPGSPNIWTHNPRSAPQDKDTVYIDHNAHLVGPNLSPLAPTFCAIDDMHKSSYDYKGLDLVTNRNNLRKLLRWANKTSFLKDFRIDVQRAGNTCLFTRREEKNSELLIGFHGFGVEYEKVATRPPRGLENAVGHHRIVSLDLGGIKVLLRFKVDACTDQTSTEDDLATALSGMALHPDEPVSSIPGITVTHLGPRTLAPQSSLIEVKTRVYYRLLDWDEVYPQLYLSQTAYLYLAKHHRGAFRAPERYGLTDSNMRQNARRAEKGLAKLKAVLDEILRAVRAEEAGTELSLVCIDGQLQLYRRVPGSGKSAGKEILAKFEY